MDNKELLINDFKEVAGNALEDLFNKMVSDRMPYLESDAQMNVEYRTREVVGKLLSGSFVVDGDWLKVEQDGFFILVQVTNLEWDKFRESLIKLMPVCPKDKKIEMLERQINEMEKLIR